MHEKKRREIQVEGRVDFGDRKREEKQSLVLEKERGAILCVENNHERELGITLRTRLSCL
jgi:hypothetical protein